MKQIISNGFILLIFFVMLMSATETAKAQNSKTVVTNQNADRLTKLYDKRNCKKFFTAFPATFKGFYQLYGYDDEKGASPLFSEGNEHIPYFFGCAEVSDFEKLNKAIGIGIGGKWEADIIGMFQDATFELVKNNPIKTKKILDTLPNKKASSFWYFLLDGAHPTDKEKVKRVELLSNLLGKDDKQSKILLAQFNKLKSSEEH